MVPSHQPEKIFKTTSQQQRQTNESHRSTPDVIRDTSCDQSGDGFHDEVQLYGRTHDAWICGANTNNTDANTTRPRMHIDITI